MIMEIHSSYGVLYAEPLKLQAIENSIPEGQDASDQDTEDAVSLTED